MALDLAHDRGRGVGRELEAAVGVESVDRLDEADGADLHEVLERLAAVLELGREEAHEVEVVHDQLLARVLVALAVTAEQLPRAVLVPHGTTLHARTHAGTPPLGTRLVARLVCQGIFATHVPQLV